MMVGGLNTRAYYIHITPITPRFYGKKTNSNRNSTDSDVFATLTYRRDTSKSDTWRSSTIHYNRFLQRLQRKIGKVEYLAVKEPHKDQYPHIHAHLRFRNARRMRKRGKYIHEQYREILRECWPHGHTDFQCPIYSGYRPIAYVLKYIAKTTSANRLWQNILDPDPNYVKPTNELGYPIKPPAGKNVWKYLSDNTAEQTLVSCPLRWKRLKLITWSRGYVNTFKSRHI